MNIATRSRYFGHGGGALLPAWRDCVGVVGEGHLIGLTDRSVK